jgi:prepilin-type N-terminal cleavage/methylation domain-containing protein
MKRMQQRTNASEVSPGFTLIELLVVVAIMVVVFGVTIASFNSFNRQERLKQTALNFKTALRFAQTRASSGDKPTSGCTTFVGMRVLFTASSYVIRHVCSEGLVGASETTTLPSGITFSPVPSTITFQALTGSTSLSAAQTITFTNSTKLYDVSVSVNGGIDELGFR